MKPEIQIAVEAGVPLVSVKRRARSEELSKVVPEACGQAWKLAKERSIEGLGRMVAIYWNGAIDLEIGIEVSAAVGDGGGLAASATPEGLVARALHRGPYSTLGQTHQALRDWVAANGHRLAGPSWEVYGHWEEAWNRDSSLIRTDICYLVEG